MLNMYNQKNNIIRGDKNTTRMGRACIHSSSDSGSVLLDLLSKIWRKARAIVIDGGGFV